MGMAGGDALVEAASGQTRWFMVGEVPPLAGGYTARPESAAEAARTLVPGSAVALASRSVPFEGSRTGGAYAVRPRSRR
jgi:hypothetical protein